VPFAAIFRKNPKGCRRARVAPRRPPVVTRRKPAGGRVSRGLWLRNEFRASGDDESPGMDGVGKLLGVVLCVWWCWPGLARARRPCRLG